MSTEEGKEGKVAKRDHGPQGTHVFSRGEVDRLIEEVGSSDDAPARAHLKGVSADIKDKSFPLHGDRIVLGRADNCDIILTDASVSSEHARLNHDAAGWRVANLLSTNGTFINNVKISNGVIHHGDRLRLGRVEFILHDPDKKKNAGSASWTRWLPWVGGAVVVAVIVWFLVR